MKKRISITSILFIFLDSCEKDDIEPKAYEIDLTPYEEQLVNELYQVVTPSNKRACIFSFLPLFITYLDYVCTK